MNRSIKTWLLVMLVLIAGIVIIGGLTRLTGSGLSMVDWQPIMGIFPPISKTQWLSVFDAYQSTPEYQLINEGMSLGKFKFIFYWEYLHRLLGRIIGLVALIPFIFFMAKKVLSSRFKKTWWVVMALIGIQGVLGWYMVKSGLVNNPHVSHFRLAAHLSLAFLIFSIVLWELLKGHFQGIKQPQKSVYRLSAIMLILISVQIIYGAFTAGLHGGHYYNTYPKMGSEWFPNSTMLYDSFVQNILNNPIMIQWIHRWLAVGLIIGCIIIFRKSLNRSSLHLQISSLLLLFSVCFQFILGILTLLSVVWIPLASMHQIGALLLLSSIILVLYFSRNRVQGIPI